MTKRIPLIAGNWKMNLDWQQAIALTQKLSWSLKDAGHDYAGAEVVVFPPFTDLRSVQNVIDADQMQLGLGAQDLSQFDSGAYTGDISGAFLKKLAVKYVLIVTRSAAPITPKAMRLFRPRLLRPSAMAWYRLFAWVKPLRSLSPRVPPPYQSDRPLLHLPDMHN